MSSAPCRDAAKGELKVLAVDRKQRKRNPAPPFTTSTLQQEAARKLGFSAQKTMRVAQQLYEGVDIGEGQVGLITYMRTDSLNLSQEAIGQIRDVIVQLYGQAGLAEEPRIFRTKSKNAQEAHEAIRPTAANVVPGDIESKLESDQFRLYSLIWKRTVACQMAPADLRHRCGGNAGRRGRPAAHRTARERLDLGDTRIHLRLSRGHGRRGAG